MSAARLALAILAGATASVALAVEYPPAHTVDQVDNYHGTLVADPYRWLEDVDAAETRQWVQAQNRLTQSVLARMPERAAFHQRLTALWSYQRQSAPTKVAGRYLYKRNDGLQNQDVLMVQDLLEDPPRVLLDPNSWSADGTVALTTVAPSPDGQWLAYGRADAGSDWNSYRIMGMDGSQPHTEVLERIKFSGLSWTKDSAGFFYSRYPDPPSDADREGGVFDALSNQKLYYHRLGTPQSEDLLIAEAPQQPKWGFNAQVTKDGRYNVIGIWRGSENANAVWVQDLGDPKQPKLDAPITRLIPEFEASFVLVASRGSTLYFRTDLDAPRGRLIAIDLKRPQRSHWRTVVAQSRDVLKHALHAGDQLVLVYMEDAVERIRRYQFNGRRLKDIPMPGLGRLGTYGSATSANISGSPGDDELFFAYSDFRQPLTVYRADLTTGNVRPLFAPELAFDPDDYVTKQVFYTSRDGTRIPMFISHKKGLKLDRRNPTLVHGYGGFDVSLTPWYSVPYFAWMEAGGVFAVANLRGGGEYGVKWHQAGIKHNKQNVFDDFIAAAGHLVSAGYTAPEHLAATGRSNGGLLMGAVTNQVPWLFSAVVADVGVMDMLRFHKFTIGWAWTGDYGSSDNAAEFETLHRYSPYHNVRRGTDYPAVMVTTGDHDDRVVPGHSYKYTAAMQAATASQDPVLIRVDTAAGHAAGKPVDKQIDEHADRLGFMLHFTRSAAAE